MIDFRLIKVIVKTTKCQTGNTICKDDTYQLSRKIALREKSATRMNANCRQKLERKKNEKYELEKIRIFSNVRIFVPILNINKMFCQKSYVMLTWSSQQYFCLNEGWQMIRTLS